MNAGNARATYLVIRYAFLVAALLWVMLGGRHLFAGLHRIDVVILIVLLILHAVMLRISVPFISAAGRRRKLEPGRLTIELPIVVTIITVYGGIAMAMVALLAYPFAVPAEGRSRVLRRALDGGMEAFFYLLVGLGRNVVLARIVGLSLGEFGLYVLFYVACLAAFAFFFWAPLKALRSGGSLPAMWRTSARDTRLWTFALLLSAWGYLCTQVLLRDGTILGLASFAPLPFLAYALHSLHDERSEMHRLRLARDAVQAMLGSRDPLPQINSLLSSIHAPAARETLQIYAALEPGDERLGPLATIGPEPLAAQIELCQRALAELRRTRADRSLQSDDEWVTVAYAVRTVDERLLGALTVHRPERGTALLPARRFERAAGELTHMLRDFRTIAATQNAAAVDTLTGLPNRRTIMRILKERIEAVTLGHPCAVLIVDVDHFKSVNDELGHAAGDRSLQIVGQTIARNTRSADRAGRIGGEEFLVIMPDTTRELALMVGERLRAAVEGSEVRHATGKPLTISVGVAFATIHDDTRSVLERADRALYEAKNRGRNRVVETA
ncbi:MAG: GGDEF domain-containing protein [Candidatus Eremiobacteraeota bacterium]|nr:GGDEF domain-containing protein [Candidatus Eremiobacteraeota bacterium]